MKCPRCRNKLTSVTTVTNLIPMKEFDKGERKPKPHRRGMKDHRACYSCNLIYNLKAASVELPLNKIPSKVDCVCRKDIKCILHHDLVKN